MGGWGVRWEDGGGGKEAYRNKGMGRAQLQTLCRNWKRTHLLKLIIEPHLYDRCSQPFLYDTQDSEQNQTKFHNAVKAKQLGQEVDNLFLDCYLLPCRLSSSLGGGGGRLRKYQTHYSSPVIKGETVAEAWLMGARKRALLCCRPQTLKCLP